MQSHHVFDRRADIEDSLLSVHEALEILGEVEAGIPIMRLIGEKSLRLVTKAGGFGSEAAMGDALMKVKQYA